MFYTLIMENKPIGIRKDLLATGTNLHGCNL